MVRGLIRRIIERQRLKREKHQNLWDDDLGYHKIIASKEYGFILELIALPVSLVIIPFLLGFFFPFPEIKGYPALTEGLMALLFGVFDLGTGGKNGDMDQKFMRFISQHRSTNPKRAIGYIQFFIYFQMTSGLIQVTGISLYVFTSLIYKSQAHFAWFFLVYSLIQFPGMLQVFESSIKSFQRFDKANLVIFLRDVFWYPVFQIVLMSIGKLVARNHPYGEMMILAIFFTASLYVGDLFAFLFGMYVFSKIIEPLGFKTNDLFKTDFLKMGIVKEVLRFVGLIWIFSQLMGIFSLLSQVWVITWLTAAASFQGLVSAGNGVANLGLGFAPQITTSMAMVSESYNNGKPELAKYYIQNGWKYFGYYLFALIPPLLILIPKALTSVFLVIPGLELYQKAIQLLPLLVLIKAMDTFRRIGIQLLINLHQRNKVIIMESILYPLQFLFTYLFLQVWNLGWMALVLPYFFAFFIQNIVSLIWIQKKVLKIEYKRVLWQGLVAPLIAGVIYAGICFGIVLVWDPLLNLLKSAFSGIAIGDIIATIIFVLITLIGFFLFFELIFYRPIYALFGGWDEQGLDVYEKARHISRIGNFLARWKYSIDKYFSSKTKLFNRFPLANYEKAFKEKDELLAMIKEGTAKTN